MMINKIPCVNIFIIIVLLSIADTEKCMNRNYYIDIEMIR